MQAGDWEGKSGDLVVLLPQINYRIVNFLNIHLFDLILLVCNVQSGSDLQAESSMDVQVFSHAFPPGGSLAPVWLPGLPCRPSSGLLAAQQPSAYQRSQASVLILFRAG